jgi:hypothetical protein
MLKDIFSDRFIGLRNNPGRIIGIWNMVASRLRHTDRLSTARADAPERAVRKISGLELLLNRSIRAIPSYPLVATYLRSVRSCSYAWTLQVRKRSKEVLTTICALVQKRAVVHARLDAKPLTLPELESLFDEFKASHPTPTRAEPRRGRGDGSPAARIKRVLTAEAGLPAEQSITQLRAELRKTTAVPLPPAVGSLDDWLRSVLDAIPASEVLNAAMTIARRVKA